MRVFYDWPFPHMCTLPISLLILNSFFSDGVVFYKDASKHISVFKSFFLPHFSSFWFRAVDLCQLLSAHRNSLSYRIVSYRSYTFEIYLFILFIYLRKKKHPKLTK